MKTALSNKIIQLLSIIKDKNGSAYFAGDYVLAEALKRFGYNVFFNSINLEIYNLSNQKIEGILKSLGEYKKRPSGFFFEGVNIYSIDKSIEENAKEKALILDSFLLDPATGEIKDFFEGAIDIQQRVIRFTDKSIFEKDIINYFRAIYLSAQLEFKIDDDIISLTRPHCSLTDQSYLYTFWENILLHSSMPSIGMENLRKLGLIQECYTELNSLIGVKQNPEWHQEGDVWNHTKMVVDAGARICRFMNLNKEESLVLMLACLCHDLGKPKATKTIEGKLTAKGHDKEGAEPALSFLNKIGVSKKISLKVISLVENHMFTHKNNFTKEEVHSLAKKIHPATIKELVLLAEADCMGMMNCQKDNGARKNLFRIAKLLGIEC